MSLIFCSPIRMSILMRTDNEVYTLCFYLNFMMQQNETTIYVRHDQMKFKTFILYK
jgi:hypothetical protein